MRWENTISIGAPVATVWGLTVDVTNWPALTPTVTRLSRLDDGPLGLGSQARIKQPGQSEAVWTVTEIEPEREFTWQTERMGLRMVGSHRLEATGDGCRNTLVLDLEGRGAGLVGRLFGRLISRSLATENAAFQRHAEATVIR